MTTPSVSVIVVSRHRPRDLMRCLAGIGQLFHPAYEVIVVADPASAELVRAGDWPVKVVDCDQQNISVARNLGLSQAAGDIVAFIDDDAVPEPTWLTHLCAPFSDPDVTAAGGYVRARNGVSFQWQGRRLDDIGTEGEVPIDGDTPQLFKTHHGFAIKTEGTNFAIRRDALNALGGFDPAFRYFLDETDLNMRLAQIKATVAVVPLAQVHHGFAANSGRTQARTPRDLTQIGASCAVFSRKYPGAKGLDSDYTRHERTQRQRLLTHMVEGRLEPGQIAPLLATFRTGWSEGLARDLAPLPARACSGAAFAPFHSAPPTAQSVKLAGRSWQAFRLRRQARKMVKEGSVVTLILLSPSARPLRVMFTDGGWWEVSGGLFGRTKRSDPLLQRTSFRARVKKEWASLVMLKTSNQTP